MRASFFVPLAVRLRLRLVFGARQTWAEMDRADRGNTAAGQSRPAGNIIIAFASCTHARAPP